MPNLSRKYLYVRVIEARGIVLHDPTLEAFVVVKLNGSFSHKHSTGYRAGIQWWDKTMCIKVDNIEYDWIAVELREKGMHIFGSDWIGELQFNVRDFKDNKVHQGWYELTKFRHHSKDARGYLHLAFQLLSSRSERPFAAPLKDIPFEEWKNKRERGFDLNKEKDAKDDDDSVDSNNSKDVELKTNTILESEHIISKNTYNILMTENPTSVELEKMQKLNQVNCLHKGNFDGCTGKRVMVAIDGSQSSHTAFENALKIVDRSRDHLFIVTIRERIVPMEFYQDRSRTILTHKMWQAAADIINKYQDLVKDTGIDYTSIMPEADDAREMLCRLAKKYKADVLVVGRHKKHETKQKSSHLRSFVAYCQKHAKCSVMVY